MGAGMTGGAVSWLPVVIGAGLLVVVLLRMFYAWCVAVIRHEE